MGILLAVAQLGVARAQASPGGASEAIAAATAGVEIPASDGTGKTLFQAASGPPPTTFVLPMLDGPSKRLKPRAARWCWCMCSPHGASLAARSCPRSPRFALRHGAPVRVLAVDVGEVDVRVRRFFDALPVSFPVLLDRDRR